MKVVTYEGQVIEGTPEKIVQKLADTSFTDSGMPGPEYMRTVARRIAALHGEEQAEEIEDPEGFLRVMERYGVLRIEE
ncbi:MAG: hypothetical protein HPY71_01835 [Firmicutes bacterium]|nr:hypothetical protein [Bacillota bacterium]